MANKVYQYYKELPSWAKGIVVVGGIAIIYFATKQTIARLRKQSESKDAKTSVENAKNELQQLSNDCIRPTITKSQADAYAEKIVKQFKGADLLLGSYDVVNQIFKDLISRS